MLVKVNIKALKISLIAFFTLMVLAAIVFYVAYVNSALIFSQRISRATQTPVTINAIDYHRRAFTIRNLVVGNPKEAYIPTAFRAEVVEVGAAYKAFFKKLVLIDKIKMDNVYIDIEFYTEDKMEGNWQALIDKMEVGKEVTKDKQQALIKKLILTNVHVTLILADGKIHRLSPINQLEFDDIKSEEGIPLKEISEIIARKMVYSILREEGLNLIVKVPIKVIKKIFPFL